MHLHCVKRTGQWEAGALLPGSLLFLASCIVSALGGGAIGLLTFILVGLLLARRPSRGGFRAAPVC